MGYSCQNGVRPRRLDQRATKNELVHFFQVSKESDQPECIAKASSLIDDREISRSNNTAAYMVINHGSPKKPRYALDRNDIRVQTLVKMYR